MTAAVTSTSDARADLCVGVLEEVSDDALRLKEFSAAPSGVCMYFSVPDTPEIF